MSGIAQFNYPAFIEVSQNLRRQGYSIHCPPEHDDNTTQVMAMGSQEGDLSDLPTDFVWGDTIGGCVTTILNNCDGVVVMEGWEESKGARIEVSAAFAVGLPIYHYVKEHDFLTPLTKYSVQKGITQW